MISIIKRNKLLFGVGLVYVFLLLFQADIAFKALGSSMYYLREMIVILPVIFMLTVAIDVLVKKEWIIKRLGQESGLLGGILALAFGSLSAGPIYAAFPIAKMLHKKGASVSNIAIILSAWAVVKVPMLANEAKFLGPTFMLIRWVLTVAFIFFIGWVMERSKVKISSEDAEREELITLKVEYCIGCGLCHRSLPTYFDMVDGKAKLLKNVVENDKYDQLVVMADKCPTHAILLPSLLG